MQLIPHSFLLTWKRCTTLSHFAIPPLKKKWSQSRYPSWCCCCPGPVGFSWFYRSSNGNTPPKTLFGSVQQSPPSCFSGYVAFSILAASREKNAGQICNATKPQRPSSAPGMKGDTGLVSRLLALASGANQPARRHKRHFSRSLKNISASIFFTQERKPVPGKRALLLSAHTVPDIQARGGDISLFPPQLSAF